MQTDYYYDESGNVFGFKRGDSEYYYIRNGQGDIIGILDSSGTQIVSYVYDSWGKLVSISGSQAETIGEANPFRYRGYYYDTETGLYYLHSRYYDPEVGRFLNADEYISDVDGPILGNNQFTYCFNNPVNMQDEGGEWPSWATKLLIGTAAIVVGVAATVATGGAAAPALLAAAKVVAVSTTVGAASGAIGHRISTGSWKGAGKAALNGAADGYMWGGIGVGASMVGKAIQVAKIGTSFGKLGTLVRYRRIRVNWNSITNHMLQRMAERGMSRSTVQWVINNGKMLTQGGGKYLYVSKRGAVVMTSSGKIITGYGSGYFDSAMKEVVKQLFG